jgi:ABC-2 type transport system permease protein
LTVARSAPGSHQCLDAVQDALQAEPELVVSWMHGFAASQPATPVIETLRGLLLHAPVGASPWHALAWCGGILAVSVAACAALFRRRTA